MLRRARFARHYRIAQSWPERAVVGSVFDVRPILPWLAFDRRYYVLALSQNSVRLVRGTFDGPVRVEWPGPTNLEVATQSHDTDEMSFVHTFVGGSGSRRKAAYHGHGVGKDDAKDGLLIYLRAIDRSLQTVLKGETAPLVVAAVDYLLPLFRQVCHYPHVVPTCIAGSPDRRSDRRLADEARPLVEPVVTHAARAAVATYRQLAGTGRTMNDVAEVVEAAHRARSRPSAWLSAGMSGAGSIR